MHDTANMKIVAEDLVSEITNASSEARLELQPQLTRILDTLHRSGNVVPTRLRNLNDQLLEEAIEARFDNLPV